MTKSLLYGVLIASSLTHFFCECLENVPSNWRIPKHPQGKFCTLHVQYHPRPDFKTHFNSLIQSNKLEFLWTISVTRITNGSYIFKQPIKPSIHFVEQCAISIVFIKNFRLWVDEFNAYTDKSHYQYEDYEFSKYKMQCFNYRHQLNNCLSSM